MVCPICESKKIITLNEAKDYNYCTNCHSALIKKTHLINYKDKYYEPRSKTAQKLLLPITLMFYNLRNIYAGLGEKNLWIDVGSGDGVYLKSVYANKKIGIEVSPFGKKAMQKSGIEALHPKNFLKSTSLGADVISYWHVIEHLENPSDYLLASRKNLSFKGKVVIGLPNIDSLEFRVFGSKWFQLFPEFHIWHFSPKGLAILLKKTGFKIDKVDYFAPEHHFASCIQSFINSTADSQHILLEVFKRHVNQSSKKISSKDWLWVLFWMSLGLPVVILFWITASLTHKPSAFVIVASPKK